MNASDISLVHHLQPIDYLSAKEILRGKPIRGNQAVGDFPGWTYRILLPGTTGAFID